MKNEWPTGPEGGLLAARVVAACADLALMVDPAGEILQATAAEGAWDGGATWAHLVGKPFGESFAPDSQFKAAQLLRDARSAAGARARELNVKGAKGHVAFRFTAVPMEGDRVLAVGRDLSALSQLQQQMIVDQQATGNAYARLREAEARYRLFFQLSDEGVVLAEAATGKVLEANPTARLMLGLGAQTLGGRALAQLFSAQAWETVQGLLAAARASGRSDEAKVDLGVGSREAHATVSLLQQGAAVLWMLRLRAPRAAATLGATRFVAMLDAVPEGFVVVGADFRVLGANAAFCALVQEPGEDAVVGEPLDRWLGRSRLDFVQVCAALGVRGALHQVSSVLRGRDGSMQAATLSAVSSVHGGKPCVGFSVRAAAPRVAMVPAGFGIPRAIDQLRELMGRVSLRDIVRESADLIEQLCLEAAMRVSDDDRAAAAQLLGLSPHALYLKLRQHGLAGPPLLLV